VYIPTHFKPDDAEVRELLQRHGAADLVTHTAKGLLASMLPFVYDPAGGHLGTLRGHFARNNEQWRLPAEGEAMAIVRGPDAYISPSWYAAKRQHGRVVPTWNYITAHVYGRLAIHDDPAWVAGNVRELTEKYEAGRHPAWSVDDAPASYVEGQLRAIVGVELVIGRIEAKFKLSQNRPAEDVEGVVFGLTVDGDGAMAEAVKLTRAGRDASS